MLRHFLLAVLLATIAGGSARSETLSGPALIDALRKGGYVLVMRHANSPLARPSRDDIEPDNVNKERQLDEAGRKSAQAMGAAVAKLRIKFGAVLTSPTYRALQTIKLAGLPTPKTVPELDEPPQGMQADAAKAQSAWLSHAVTERPPAGIDTLIVTHVPNITVAFAERGANVAAGESLVFRPDGKGGEELVARIKIEDWPDLEKAR